MSSVQRRVSLGLVSWLAMAVAAQAQVRPYIGYVYPAGGQQGTTFQVKLGGQGLEDVNGVQVTGSGVSAKIIEFHRRLGNQETTLLNEQVKQLKSGKPAAATGPAAALAPTTGSDPAMMASGNSPAGSATTPAKPAGPGDAESPEVLITKIETRLREFVQRPACASLSSLVIVEVTLASDAVPGERELRLATARGVSNPLVFCVGQVPEVCRKPMLTASFQVLGKEELALRKRPADEVEARINVPCTMNGQIASGEENRYRFEARQGQRLVISAQARQLIPYVADAVPGWFQPVLTLYDARGKEVAFNDDYRFKPDPLISYQVPRDGEYVLSITDAIYRGREDFVYRLTIGELPFVTSIFPLGGRVGQPVKIEMKGWNLEGAELQAPATDAGPGVQLLAAHKQGVYSNRVPFVLDTLPESFEKEPNNDVAHAQKVQLPLIVNGRINRPDDWDVFQFKGRADETVVAEVSARRLDSPLDSVLKITDATGKVLAFNDDHEDLGAGTNTHDADSYLLFKLPADGTYFVHLGDTARHGGEEYAYRLRISAPQPDFALRLVPSSLSLRSKSSGQLTVHVIRKDGYKGPIKVRLKDPPPGFSMTPVALADQPLTRVNLKTDLVATPQPVSLNIEGFAQLEDREIAHVAVPAEDRMQAFLWRHLVPADELKVLVFNPTAEPQPKRVRRTPAPPPVTVSKPAVAPADPAPGKGKFTKQQVAGRLRQIKMLFEDGLLTESFYDQKVAECEAMQ